MVSVNVSRSSMQASPASFKSAALAPITKEAAPDAGTLYTGGHSMNATVEQLLITKIKALSPQQVAEVVDFVEFLAARSAQRAALDRLLAIAPALEAAGVEPMSEDEIAAEVKASRVERAERRARLAATGSAASDAGADRS
jgi:hypothetical protein